MDVLDRLKNLERSTGERFPGAVVIVSRHTVVDAVVQSIARFKTIEEAQAYLTARRERYIKSEANASRCADAALNERLKNDPNKKVSNGF